MNVNKTKLPGRVHGNTSKMVPRSKYWQYKAPRKSCTKTCTFVVMSRVKRTRLKCFGLKTIYDLHLSGSREHGGVLVS